jgi:putative ABC transport system permease protein
VKAPMLPSEILQLIDAVLERAALPPATRDEVERDLRAHFEDGLASGRPPGELVERFGDPGEAGARIAEARRRPRTPTSEPSNGVGGSEWGIVTGELRRAVRSLVAAPLFSAMVVATLALGVGANTAVFTALDAVLLEPLPYPDADRLVRVYEVSLEDGTSNYLRGLGVLEYGSWEDVFESFGVLYTYREAGGDITEADTPERVVVSLVDAGFFDVMGVAPLLGRTFRPEESRIAGEGSASLTTMMGAVARVAILSERLWARRFGRDPGVVGRQLHLDGETLEVVGVMPASFTTPFGSTPDLWIPQNLTPGGSNSWGNHYISGVAKLREGVSLGAAQERVDALADAMRRTYPEAGDWGVSLVPLREAVVGGTRRTMLLVLAGAVALVLLSACVNVGNLVFARNLGRAREIAVRGALGAGRPRLLMHLLSESAVLAVAGGVAGVAVGWLGVRGLLGLAPDALPAQLTPEPNVRLFLVALAAATAALVLFGLAPALHFSAAAPGDAMREGGRGGTERKATRRARGALVAAQVAAAVVLVVGSGLLVRSFAALTRVELGVEPEGVLTFEVHLPVARYPDGAARHRLHDELQRRVAALPGVGAAGATSWLPVNGRYHTWGLSSDPGNLDNDDAWLATDVRMVAGSYFDALGIDVLRGEPLESLDAAGPLVVWLSRSLALRAFGDSDPVGRMVQVAGEPRRVAGVVEDVRHDPRAEPFPTVYVPHAHYADNRNWALVQTVRARGDLRALEARVRDELRALDPNLVLYRPRPMDALLESSRAQDRFATALMGAFALLALCLSSVGIYGVVAGLVERKRREIGIRIALGARSRAVRAMVLRTALGLAVVGSAAGVLASWLGARALESLLFEVEPLDVSVFAAAVTLLTVLSVTAAWIPARRATRTDPARALVAE